MPLRRSTPPDTQIDQELAFHLDELTADHIRRGLSPAEARRRATLDFGGREQIKQQVREVHTSRVLESLTTNLRSAFRFIRRAPGFAFAVIVTLALGIGANSAVFSAIDAILLRPLPFPHAGELVRIHQLDIKSKIPETFVAPARLEDWNRLSHSFQVISGYYTDNAILNTGELPEKITLALVAPRFLQLWGVNPALGRDFTVEEFRFNGPNAILVSNRFWRTHLQSSPTVVGQPLHIGKSAYTIVGVLPPSFLFPDRDVDLFAPNAPDAPYSQNRASTWFITLGRLKAGVSVARAQAELGNVQTQLGHQYPVTDAELALQLQPLKSLIVGGIQGSLWLLYASVSLLLFIACINIAALLLARAAEREHEIAIRYSLGAPRHAIISQLLTEVFVLALFGSVLGLLVAAGASRAFTLLAKDLPRIDEIGLNLHVIAYSLGCALFATILCGLLPAVRATRRNLAGSISHSSRTQVSALGSWQWTLLGIQVSLAVSMLIASGLLIRSFQALGAVSPGFDPGHVLTLRVSGSWGETSDGRKLTQRINRTLDTLRAVPGVEAAATSATMPGNSLDYPVELKLLETSTDTEEKIVASMHFVSAGYFATLHIPLLAGESCQQNAAVDTVLINRSFAQKFFAGSPAIGYHLETAESNIFTKPAEIRGIVGDAREQGVDTAPEPSVYWCTSAPTADPTYLIRTHGDPAAMADILRRKIAEIEPARSVFGVMPLVDHLEDRLAESRLRTILLSAFAFTAIALVSVGLYGTISYLGRVRRREVALRLALGAMPSQIVRRFMFQGLRVTAIGAVAGLLAGMALSRLLHGMLYAVSPLDPTTYSGVLTFTLLVALAASSIPAMRAVRVSPSTVLREE